MSTTQTLEDYLRESRTVDHNLHVTELTDSKIVFRLSPSGLAGDPVEITLRPERKKEDEK